MSCGVTAREAFPHGIPIGQFPTPDDAYTVVALTFPLALPSQHWRAWTRGRRLAWLPSTVPADAEAGGEWHERMASQAQQALAIMWRRITATTN